MLAALLDFFHLGPKNRVYVRVTGQVMFSGYHLFIERTVRSLGLQGWQKVVQLPNQCNLEMEVEGTTYRLQKLIDAIRNRPADAAVFKADVQWKTYVGNLKGYRTRA